MPKIIDKVAKQRQIMDAALALFLEKGYKTVTTREIASRAGVSKGVLYDYFKSKEDLFYRTIRENILKKMIYKSAVLDMENTPLERYDKLKDQISRNIETREKRFRMMADFVVNCPDRELVNEVIGSFFDTARKFTSKIVSEAFPKIGENPQKAELYASIIIAFIDGIVFQHQYDANRVNMNETLDLFWEIMTENLSSHTTTDEPAVSCK